MSSITLTHAGLPDKIKDRQSLVRLVCRVGRQGLGLNDRQVRYLKLAIWSCRETDFAPGSICAHWLSVTAIATELSCTVRQVHNIECALEHKGLIARTIGSGGRRRGVRDAAGKVCWVEGIDLGPLLQPAMLDRLLECQGQLEQEELALEILRTEIQLTRRLIRANGDDDAMARSDAILPRGRTSRMTDRARLEEILDALRAIHAVISEACGAAEISDADAVSSDASEILDAPYILPKTSQNPCTGKPEAQPATISPRQAILLASTSYQARVERYGGPTLANLVEASCEACSDLGISAREWGSLCSRIGREAAALTILIVDRSARLEEDDRYHARKPMACARGIASRVETSRGNLRGMLLAGQSMDLDRDLPPHLAQRRQGAGSQSIGALAAQALSGLGGRAWS